MKSKYGEIAHAVASIGGGWSGKTILEVYEERWGMFYIESITGHYAIASAFDDYSMFSLLV
ncbi:hypothetical protein NST84_15555 [Paenibacillus sp. FSL R7-0345]|uniref:hypothetical protein n=1 Tax=Paenibacillus sp. FSL R7-0345 TaxID=2954535 RepID=UPI003159C807